MEGEGGGEDEGGEGDAVGHQVEGEDFLAAWSDIAKLNWSFSHIYSRVLLCPKIQLIKVPKVALFS